MTNLFIKASRPNGLHLDRACASNWSLCRRILRG
jgi:hypothetical protein